jgi:hypothetical protein
MARLVESLFHELNELIRLAGKGSVETEQALWYHKGYMDALGEVYDMLTEHDDDPEEDDELWA